MSRKYKHIFFDLDHTLWDFDKNSELTLKQLYNEYELEKMGIIDFDEFFKVFCEHNDRLWERFRKGYIKRYELRWKRFWLTMLDFKIADTALAHELSSAYMEILPTQTALVPSAKEVLDHCKDKYTIHLLTNGFETTQWLKLQYSGIASYFTHVVTSEKGNSLKPYPEIFSYALQACGGECSECIMIGDALDVDIAGALNAGWDQVYYNPKKNTHDKKPTYEVHHLSDLLNIL